MFMKMVKPLLSDINSQSWTANIWTYFLMLVALVGVPLLVMYIIYWFGRVNEIQMGRTFGNDNQVVVGGLGNVVHELEMCLLAKIGGHSLQDVHLSSWHDLSHFKAVASVEHVWVSHNLFQGFWSFFMGVLPVYITGSMLWGIQILLGGTKFHLTKYPGGMFGWHKLLHIFLANIVLAYSTGNILKSVLFFILVLLIASTAFALTWSEVRRALSGSIIWCSVLFVAWAIMVFAHVLTYITPSLWAVMTFSAIVLAHVLMYLVVMIAIASFFHLLDILSKNSDKD